MRSATERYEIHAYRRRVAQLRVGEQRVMLTAYTWDGARAPRARVGFSQALLRGEPRYTSAESNPSCRRRDATRGATETYETHT